MRNLSRFKASQPFRGNSQSLGAGRKLGPCFKISICSFFPYLLCFTSACITSRLLDPNTIFSMYCVVRVFSYSVVECRILK